MKKIKKKPFVMLLVIITLLIISIVVFYLTRKPIYFVSDSIYYQTTIKEQKSSLKLNALINNRKVIFIVDDLSDSSWTKYNYKRDSLIVLSPYLSMMKNLNSRITFDNNRVIGIDDDIKVDYLSGYEKLANELKKENKTIYLIYSQDWPSSVTKANVFEKAYGQDNLKKFELIGNELEQKAYEIVDSISETSSSEVVSTGSVLIPYFANINKSIIYNFEAYQALSVPLNSLHYIIYQNLTPLVKLDKYNEDTLVLESQLKNNQEGLVNFFLHLYRDLQQLFF